MDIIKLIHQTLNGLFYVVCLQSILIIIFLVSKRQGLSEKKFILILLLINLLIFLTGSFILTLPEIKDYHMLGHVLSTFIFLSAPLLYFYFTDQQLTSQHFTGKLLPHFLPFLITLGIIVSTSFYYRDTKVLFRPYSIFLVVLLLVQNSIYFIGMYRKLVSREKRINTGDQNRWFRMLLAGFSILLLTKLLIFVTWNIMDKVYLCIYFVGILFIIAFILMNSLILFALHKPEMIISKFKYIYSNKSIDQKRCILQSTENVILNENMFTDSLLTLKKLAKTQNITEQYLSQVINELTNMNFNEYINKFRIKYAQKLLEEGHSYNILEIAYESGFNSKSTFNTAFKKITGVTPTEYRDLKNSYFSKTA